MLVLSKELEALAKKLQPADRVLTDQELSALAAKFPARRMDARVSTEKGLQISYDYSSQNENSRWATALNSPITETWRLQRLTEHQLTYESILVAAYVEQDGYLAMGPRSLRILQDIWDQTGEERTKKKTTAQTVLCIPNPPWLVPHLRDEQLQFYCLTSEVNLAKAIKLYQEKLEQLV